MTNRESYRIMKLALETYKKRRGSDEINYTELSKKIGTTISSLWFYFKGQRRWPADIWLRTLKELGALHQNENTILITIKPPDRGY